MNWSDKNGGNSTSQHPNHHQEEEEEEGEGPPASTGRRVIHFSRVPPGKLFAYRHTEDAHTVYTSHTHTHTHTPEAREEYQWCVKHTPWISLALSEKQAAGWLWTSIQAGVSEVDPQEQTDQHVSPGATTAHRSRTHHQRADGSPEVEAASDSVRFKKKLCSELNSRPAHTSWLIYFTGWCMLFMDVFAATGREVCCEYSGPDQHSGHFQLNSSKVSKKSIHKLYRGHQRGFPSQRCVLMARQSQNRASRVCSRTAKCLNV